MDGCIYFLQYTFKFHKQNTCCCLLKNAPALLEFVARNLQTFTFRIRQRNLLHKNVEQVPTENRESGRVLSQSDVWETSCQSLELER